MRRVVLYIALGLALLGGVGGLVAYFFPSEEMGFSVRSERAGLGAGAGKREVVRSAMSAMGYKRGGMMPILGEFLDGNEEYVGVEWIEVYLTDKKQDLMQSFYGETLATAVGQEYEAKRKVMKIRIYLNPELYGESESINEVFEREVLRVLFYFSRLREGRGHGTAGEEAGRYLREWRERFGEERVLVRVWRAKGLLGVGEVWGWSCTGTYQCGTYQWVCSEDSSRGCSTDWQCAGYGDSCVSTCVGNGVEKSCDYKTTSSQCNSVSGQCSSGTCLDSSTYSCSWTCCASCWSVCSAACGDGTQTNECGGTKDCNLGSCCTVTKPAVPGVVSPVAPFTEKSGTVTLRWSAVSSWGEECSGTGTRRYEICVGPNSSDPCTGGVNIIASGEASVSATVTGLTSAINYWKIRAINKGGGISDWSSMNNFCFWGSNSLRPLAVGDWSACDGVSHSRNRSCVAGCDCGGVDLAEVCETEVRGTIFDASFRAVCPGADVNGYLTGLSAEEYAGGAQFALVDGDNSPPTGWSGRLGATTVSNGNYSLNVYGLADYTFDFSDLAGGFDISAGPKLVCNGGSVTALGSDPLCLVQPCELVRNMSFGFNRIYGGWWQTRGGSVYAKNGVQSVIPGTFPGEQRLLLEGADGRRGALLYGNKIDNQLGNNPNARVSNWLWEKLGAYDGARYDYDFYKSRMSVFVMTPWDGDSEDIAYDGSGNDAARGYKILKRDADSVVNLAGSVPAGEKYILLVNGDVRVTSDVVVEEGGFFGVVAKGEIEMASNVARAEGFYVGNVISVPCHDVGGDGCDRDDIQFVGEGSFVGWTGINLSRDMEMGNNTASAEYFVYREDLAENAPAPMKVYSRRFLPFVP